MSLVEYTSSSEDEGDTEPRAIVPLTIAGSQQQTISGLVQKETMDPYTFAAQKRLYDRMGGSSSVKVKRRKNKGNASDLDGDNAYKGPWAEYSESSESDIEDEINANYNVEPAPPEEGQKKKTVVEETETSEYFGREDVDIMDPPASLKTKLVPGMSIPKYYVPKKKVHKYIAHTGGVQALQFLPESGHLLLSCGNDSQIKLWDVYHERGLLRSYSGHSKAVKFVQFNRDGTRFVSCSYDRWVKMWDTESGKCIYRRRTHSFPNVVKFNPQNDNEILVGLSKREVEHYDITSEDIVQSYGHHLGAVNSVEFINDGANFVTSSEDKTLKIWDMRINMPIKQIADPKQHSMPFLRAHPSGKYFVAQSMDNSIQTFSTNKSDKFRHNKKKTFRGHSSTGYSIGVQFTPDGRNLVSGDAYGNCCFWDWNTTRLVKKIKMDERIISCVDTHPLETSMLAAAGLSGSIYLYS